MVSLRPTLHNLGPSQKPKGLKTFRCSAALLRPTESTITIPYPGKHHYHICRFNIQHLHKSLPSKVTLGLKKKKAVAIQLTEIHLFSKAKQRGSFKQARLPPTTPGEVRDPPRTAELQPSWPFKLSGGNNNTI